MGLNLLGLGKKIEDIIGGVGNAAESFVGIHPTFNQPQRPQQQGSPPSAVNLINQSTGFNNTPVQFNPLTAPPPPVSLTTPTVKKINSLIGGSPVQQAQNAPINPNAQQVNPYEALSDYVTPRIPLVGQAVQFAQDQAAHPDSNTLRATGKFLGAITGTGIVNSPIGAAARIAGQTAATFSPTEQINNPVLNYLTSGNSNQPTTAYARQFNEAQGPVDKALNVAGDLVDPLFVGTTAHGTPASEVSAKRASQVALKPVSNETGGGTLGPSLENPQALQEIKQGNASALAKSFEKSEGNALGNVPPAVNTAKNPVQVAIPKVEPGDYSQIIANEQAASRPVSFAGDRWSAAMQNLNDGERANFWRAVEKDKLSPEYQKQYGLDKPFSSQMKQALSAWRRVDDKIHATSQTLGGNTNYLENHGLHPWDLPEELANHITSGGNPDVFQGLNSISRKHPSIEEGEKSGLTLGEDPVTEGNRYIGASSYLLGKRAIVKGLGEADSHIPEKTHNLTLGVGPDNTYAISGKAHNALRGLQRSTASNNVAIKGARTVNTGLKSSILSLGQFHPINISLLRAAPTLALEGHPVAATRGAFNTFRVLAPGGKRVVERTLNKAQTDTIIDPGTGKPINYVDAAAKIGAPYGAGGFDAEGSFLKGGLGHETVFGKQMPMMHDQVVRSIVNDLVSNNTPLDSQEARIAGRAGNNLMGFVNSEAQKIPPQVNRGLGDLLLAKQFTHSKFSQARTAVTKGGVGGSYARANIAANVLATTAVATGIGYLLKQKSDNLRDTLLRALVDPAIPTPLKDAKGNTLKLRTPGTDTSDIAKLLGVSLVRGADGHLGVTWKPDKVLATNGTVMDFLRARLSPIASAGVKLSTNTSFAGKPLYDPNAPLGTQAQQAATSIIQGNLPIGLQGVPYAVKGIFPQGVQDVLNASSPGSNPIVKSIGSSFGLTPATDTTVGKGEHDSQHFSNQTDAKQGLNRQEQDAFDIVTGGKKNPVTGKYEIDPTVYDSPTKANLLLQNPKTLEHLTAAANKDAADGIATDPFYTKLTPDQQKKVLQMNRLDPLNPDKTQLIKQAGQWYQDYQNASQSFFNSLPPGDPNKPKYPVQYTDPSASVQALADKYYSLTDPAEKASFIKNNPSIQQSFDATANYDKEIRAARGLPELKGYPKAAPQLQGLLDQYDSLDKAGRSALGKSHPEIYDYFQRVSQYTLENDATQARYVGNDFTPKGVKAIESLANDISYNGGLLGSSGQTIAPTGGAAGGGSAISKYRARAKAASAAKADTKSLARATRSAGRVRLQQGYNQRGYKALGRVHSKYTGYSLAGLKGGKATQGVKRPRVSLKSEIS